MRNLKRVLALCLAAMMLIGMMVIGASAASATDKYADAAQDLYNYGVLHGYNAAGDLGLDRNITRAEMAAIVYRILTGDTDTADDTVAAENYGAYAAQFSDASAAKWAIGYIGFCANEGVIKGYPDGSVKPNEPITGYEVLVMLLRAVGRGQNDEYSGSMWNYNALADATQLGIYGSKAGVNQDPASPAPRGAVAQMTLNATTKTDRVAPAVYPNVGYTSLGEPLIVVGKSSRGSDAFGAPSTIYNVAFTWPENDVESTKEINDEPLAEFWTKVSQATVDSEAGLKGTPYVELDVYTNGYSNVDSNVKIYAAKTSLTDDPIGQQGRLTLVYADRIVYKDVFLGNVDSSVSAMKVNGITVRPASSSATVYYGEDEALGTGAWFTSGLNAGSLSMGTWFWSFGLTKNGDPAANGDVTRLVNPTAITATKVTVNAIVKDTAGNETGIVATNGKTYPYNFTYGYNTGIDNTRLTDDAIGGVYYLYLDSKGNILGLYPEDESVAGGVGVVVDSDVYRIGAAKYAAELTILDENNQKQTVRILENANTATVAPYADEGTAANAIKNEWLGQLVRWAYDEEAKDAKYPGYYYIVDSTETTIAATVDANGKTEGTINVAVFDEGDAEAITGGPLVNDNTVFFIANYKMTNSKTGYTFQNYSIIKGFKNIKDRSYTVGETINGMEDYAGRYDIETALVVEYFGGATASYVLIVNATEYANNTKEPVDSYAFIANPTQFVKVYDNYYQYTSIINGRAGQALDINYKVADAVQQTGLYTYDQKGEKNEGYNVVNLSKNTIAGGDWSYAAGVLTNNGSNTADTGTYITVADNVAIYLVNPDTGTSTKLDYKLNEVRLAYGADDIWFQLNQYGWIDLVYVVGEIASGVPGGQVLSSAAVTLDPGVNGGPITDAEVTNDGTGYAVTYRVQKMSRANGSSWSNCGFGESFNYGAFNYRVYVTLVATGSNVFANGITASDITGVTAKNLAVAADGSMVTFTVDIALFS